MLLTMLGARPPDGQHDVGIADRLGVGLGDLRARRLVVLIGEVGPRARRRSETVTLAPALTSFFTVSGVSPMRGSS